MKEKNFSKLPGFEPEMIRKNIVSFIRKHALELGRQGAVVGLSGGIDSALVLKLCVDALGADNVTAVMLPERDSSRQNIRDAKKFAAGLGVRIIYKRLTPVLSFLGVYRLYPPTFIFRRSVIEKFAYKKRRDISSRIKKDIFIANLEGGADKELSKAIAFYRIKHRLRATVLFYYSELYNYLLAGCANKSEWLTGFFVRYGDSIADIMPILTLYKTQVFSLAGHLGLPDYLLQKAPSPDLVPGLNDEEALQMTYEKLDLILACFERGYSLGKIIDISGATKEEINRVSEYKTKSEYLRKSPIILDQ